MSNNLNLINVEPKGITVDQLVDQATYRAIQMQIPVPSGYDADVVWAWIEGEHNDGGCPVPLIDDGLMTSAGCRLAITYMPQDLQEVLHIDISILFNGLTSTRSMVNKVAEELGLVTKPELLGRYSGDYYSVDDMQEAWCLQYSKKPHEFVLTYPTDVTYAHLRNTTDVMGKPVWYAPTNTGDNVTLFHKDVVASVFDQIAFTGIAPL